MKLRQFLTGSVVAGLLTSVLAAPSLAQTTGSDTADRNAGTVTERVVPLSDIPDYGGAVGWAPLDAAPGKVASSADFTVQNIPPCGYRLGVFTWSYRNCHSTTWKLIWRQGSSLVNFCTTMAPGSYVYNIPRGFPYVRDEPGRCQINIPIG